ncbi:MAG: hypothetical protein WBD58_00805 [Geitlerinemataceae cyanobacterium]
MSNVNVRQQTTLTADVTQTETLDKARRARETLRKAALTAKSIRKETLGNSDEDRQTDLLVGKTVDRIVATPTGTLLLAPGQRISPSTVKTAEHWGMLDDLFMAVARSGNSLLNLQSSDSVSGQEDELPSSKTQASPPIGTHNCGIKAIEERRIQNALGKPAHRTIVDRHGETILESGNIVTPEAIDRAKRAGILDILFSAIRSETLHEQN